MSGFATNNTDHMIRSNLWSAQIKDVFEYELQGMKYVDMLSEFPDGDTWNIPSVGQLPVLDYVEGQAVRYNKMDTGNYTFTISEYKSSAVSITNKMKQDSFWAPKLISMFPYKMNRAIMSAMETDLLAVGPEAQTASDYNLINGARHRFVGTGTNETLSVEDFAHAKYALQKAGVPMTNLVALVDPSVAVSFNKLTGISDVTYNPQWEGIITTGISTGMRFVRNIYGFDVYESNFLKTNAGSETIGGLTASAGVNNLFFSAAPEALPFLGAVRQAPKVDSEYNKDLQQDEYVTTCRYGFGLYRPESLVVVLTDTDQVYA